MSDCLKLFEPGLNGRTHRKLVRAAVQSAVVRGSARGHARYSEADALYTVRDRPFIRRPARLVQLLQGEHDA